jgi:hypothetical protein
MTQETSNFLISLTGQICFLRGSWAEPLAHVRVGKSASCDRISPYTYLRLPDAVPPCPQYIAGVVCLTQTVEYDLLLHGTYSK